MWLAHDSVFVTHLARCGARTGFATKPILQPVMAYDLDAPSQIIVLSYISGNAAMLLNSAP